MQSNRLHYYLEAYGLLFLSAVAGMLTGYLNFGG